MAVGVPVCVLELVAVEGEQAVVGAAGFVGAVGSVKVVVVGMLDKARTSVRDSR